MRDGTPRRKVWFAALIGLFLFSTAVLTHDIAARLDEPSIGWMVDGWHISPMRRDAADAGLRGGGQLLEINGHSREGLTYREIAPYIRTRNNDVNTLTVRRPTGQERDVNVLVRPLKPDDVLFGHGALIGLGVLALLAGLFGFLLRPYERGSWALLAFAAVAGSLVMHLPVNVDPATPVKAVLIRSLIGFMPAVIAHIALALPVVHPMLHRRPSVLWMIYSFGALNAAYGVGAWHADYAGLWRHLGGIDTGTMLLAMLFFVGRCFVHAVRAPDPVVAQRARILLAGTIFGGAPPMLLRFLQNALGVLIIDLRVVYWTFSILLVALAYTTVRQDLLNARIAVRRAIIYVTTMAILTGLALVLIAFRPYAVALLLLPLLYFWPRFDARVNAWLYPKRQRFGELIRTIGEEMATCTTVDDILAVLAQTPARLCDARSCVVFLLPEGAMDGGHAAVAGRVTFADANTLVDEPLIRLMATTRQHITRESIAIDPQFVNIKAECHACMDRLHADVLLPLLRGNTVIGGLAVGPRVSDDPYESPELDAITGVTQQAVQAVIRAEATARLRDREAEFSNLNRFLSPQIIEQVMARGGAAELRTQRKLVTVFFADLRGFTSFSDSVEPEEVMATLAEYHHVMGRRIEDYAGTLERFAGDGFMVFFNDPVEQHDHVQRAVGMALAMRQDVVDLREGWLRKDYRIDVGMGIHTGYATCGFVGYEGRRDYSVIGNVTNMAARLSDAAAGGEILVTPRVMADLGSDVTVESAGALTLKGFHQPQEVYRILDAPGA